MLLQNVRKGVMFNLEEGNDGAFTVFTPYQKMVQSKGPDSRAMLVGRYLT